MKNAVIFNYKGLSEQELADGRLARNLGKPPGQRWELLLELLDLSDLFQKNKANLNMTQLKTELIGLFQALNLADVEYLVVGGFAVNAAGFSRYTADLDLWLHDTPENRARLVAAGQRFGLPGAEQLGEMAWAPGWSGFRLESGFEVEIMSAIKGFSPKDFPACAARAAFSEYAGVLIPTLHIDDVLIAKKALARPKDEEDVRQLERIKKLKKD